MGFENHIHGFKRTKPLRGGKVVDKGTVYIGDGSWGPLIGNCKEVNQDLMENNGILHHIWLIELDQNQQLSAVAVSPNKKEIDSFVTTCH